MLKFLIRSNSLSYSISTNQSNFLNFKSISSKCNLMLNRAENLKSYIPLNSKLVLNMIQVTFFWVKKVFFFHFEVEHLKRKFSQFSEFETLFLMKFTFFVRFRIFCIQWIKYSWIQKNFIFTHSLITELCPKARKHTTFEWSQLKLVKFYDWNAVHCVPSANPYAMVGAHNASMVYNVHKDRAYI